MNAIDSAREARSQNLARLRKLTIGTAALAVTATSGFGWLAAMTYAGATTSATTTAFATTSTTSGTTSAVAAPAITSTTSAAHVSSGGS